MSLKIKFLEKKYEGDNPFHLNVSLDLPDRGLICILGKSGCGKSTLLHCIGSLENIDSGSIKLNDVELTKLKRKDKEVFLNKEVSYIFQNYQLLNDLSVVDNISLPMEIMGVKRKRALKKAKKLLDSINFNKDKYNQKVDKCSGGEKQRVAILRSIINEPALILADEPTGALDSNNSKMVMDLLKAQSLESLVIVVTHNGELAAQYADRIITMKDGKILTDIAKVPPNNEKVFIKKSKQKPHNSWINSIISKNLIKRFKRNLVSGFGLTFSLIFAFLLFGFSNGSTREIDRSCLRQFDLGCCTVSHQKVTQIDGSSISLVKQTRLSNLQLNEFLVDNDYFISELNYQYFVPQNTFISYDKTLLNEYSYNPVYSFGNDLNPDLLIKGKMPMNTLREVLVNKKLEDDFKKKFNKDIIGEELNASFSRELIFYFDDDITPYVVDNFEYNQNFKVVGVVDELNFLNTPKIYYSYSALNLFMDRYNLPNLSNKLNSQISLKDKIDQAQNNDEITSYSNILFLKKWSDFKYIEDFHDESIVLSSNSLTIKEALKSFAEASTMGMELFFIITVIGSVLILGITSFSSYTHDRHNNAILLSLGAKRDDIFEIYIMETLIISLFSFFISLGIAFMLEPAVNSLIFIFTGFSKMIEIPFKSWMNLKFGLPLFVFAITFVTSFFSTAIPMLFAEKISISKELKEE